MGSSLSHLHEHISFLRTRIHPKVSFQMIEGQFHVVYKSSTIWPSLSTARLYWTNQKTQKANRILFCPHKYRITWKTRNGNIPEPASLSPSCKRKPSWIIQTLRSQNNPFHKNNSPSLRAYAVHLVHLYIFLQKTQYIRIYHVYNKHKIYVLKHKMPGHSIQPQFQATSWWPSRHHATQAKYPSCTGYSHYKQD